MPPADPTSRLRLITGKGGVGKTVVATAIAMREAQAGARTLLCEINGRDRVATLLGVEPIGYGLRQIYDNLWVVDINPHDALHEYALLIMRFEALYKAVFENALVRRFLRLVPSLNELVMMGKVWFHAQERVNGRPRFDVIIIDAPATGHALALLRAPRAVQKTVPPGPMRDNARLIEELLTRRQTTLHVVTTPEDMPVTEACEILQAIEELGMHPGTVFINQCVEPLAHEPLSALQPLADDPLTAPALQALRVRQSKQEAGEAHLQRLPEALLQHAVRLPRLVGEGFDNEALSFLAQQLSAWLVREHL